MKELWRRLVRLVRESRIRLDVPELRFEAIHPGDRVQIGPRLWRVDRLRPGEPSFELVGDGGARAHLRFMRSQAFRPWVLESGEARIRLASRDLLHFPLGNLP